MMNIQQWQLQPALLDDYDINATELQIKLTITSCDPHPVTNSIDYYTLRLVKCHARHLCDQQASGHNTKPQPAAQVAICQQSWLRWQL